jgi:glutathionylspermidine synthase
MDNLHLRQGRLWLIDRPVDALYRYYPFETLLGTQAFADLFAAVAGGRLRLLNGLRGLLAQNKGVLAWLWSHRDDRVLFTAEERRAIAEHLPAVTWIDEHPQPSAAERRELVLKQVFGREGEEVYFGERISDADWRRCRAWGSYVVQWRVRAEPLPAVIRTSSGPAIQSLWPAVGSFTAAGRWAGYYTRLGAPITSARAKYVGTFIE